MTRRLPYGPDAVLVEVESATAAASLASWARSAQIAATEIVPAARTVLFDGVDPARLDLSGWPGPGAADSSGTLVEIPVSYDGPDLEVVAGIWKCSPAEVVQRHQEIEFTSVFCGFAPGFAYLSGLPTELALPRLESPRPAVPAGSVALADTWCGVYPNASPGGWLLIGQTREQLWDQTQDPPALLAPGRRVRFVAVSG